MVVTKRNQSLGMDGWKANRDSIDERVDEGRITSLKDTVCPRWAFIARQVKAWAIVVFVSVDLEIRLLGPRVLCGLR